LQGRRTEDGFNPLANRKIAPHIKRQCQGRFSKILRVAVIRSSRQKVAGENSLNVSKRSKNSAGEGRRNEKIQVKFQIDETASQVKENRVNQTTLEVSKRLPLSGKKLHYWYHFSSTKV
jgi:hypothetical protein